MTFLWSSSKLIITVPGVPRELKRMRSESIAPFLQKKMGTDRGLIEYKVLKVCGLGESREETQILLKHTADQIRQGISNHPGLFLARSIRKKLSADCGLGVAATEKDGRRVLHLGCALRSRSETYEHAIGGPPALLADRVTVMALDWLRKILPTN